jgi:hypothetical protein
MPRNDAPPASAIMATLLRATTTRNTMAFIGKVLYQPLETNWGLTLAPPSRPPRTNAKTDRTAGGRSVALLAQLHPKCPISGGASARPSFLMLLPSTGVLRIGRTIGTRKYPGQYGTLPMLTRIRAGVARSRAGRAWPTHSARTVPPRLSGHRSTGRAEAASSRRDRPYRRRRAHAEQA